VNIDDVEIEDGELTIESVFAKQHELMKVYREIEGRHFPLDLDTREGQAVVKDFLWRITEEVGEALDSSLGASHVKEEMADAMHFLVELCIFTDREEVGKDAFVSNELPLGRTNEKTLWVKLANVGRVCKNKPWKQTQIPLDQQAFTAALTELIWEFMEYCGQKGFQNATELYFYYHKKAVVNEFRQRSKY